MQTHGSVTKKKFAEMRKVTQGRVSQWITERKIHGEAIEGEGPRAKINVTKAYEQLDGNLDALQVAAQGKVPDQPGLPDQGAAQPATMPPPTEQQRINAARALTTEISAERALRDFDHEKGRYMITEQGDMAWAKILGTIMASQEENIEVFATDVARALGSSDFKTATAALRTSIRAWRAAMTELGVKEMEAAEPLVADPERRSDQQAA